jgi:hypothetical protein
MFELALSGLRTLAIECTQGGKFLNFPTWYEYVCKGGGTHDFVFLSKDAPSDIPLVLLAIVDILLRAAGIIAVGYVIFGGIKYVTSQGESDKTSEAKGTIINALAGLLIATFAVALVNFLGNRVG